MKLEPGEIMHALSIARMHLRDIADSIDAGVVPENLKYCYQLLWGVQAELERVEDLIPSPGYTEPLPDFGDLMTVDDFRGAVALGFFTDYDGSGEPVKDGLRDLYRPVYPSRVDDIPKDATHIMWYNK